MTKASGSANWWQASDGNWYPPELHPSYAHGRGGASPNSEAGTLLATDGERDEAIEILGKGLASGQITSDEYNERVGAVLEARTRADVAKHVIDIGQPHPTPTAQRRIRPGLVATSLAVVAGLAAVFTAVVLSQHDCVQPNASGAGCLALPPAHATLSGSEVSLGATPKADYLGDKRVLTAHGTGSQTTPGFSLDGGVLTATATEDAQGAYFYVVPIDQKLDVTQAPSWQAPPALGSGNQLAMIPPAGKYRLYVLAPAGTHWNVTLNEFWLAPPGVTEAPAALQHDPGQTLVEVRGNGNYKSPLFALPEGDLFTNSEGYDYAVIGAVASAPGSSMYLVPPDGQAIPVNNLSSSPGVEGSFALPGPGLYYLQVVSSGSWVFALQYGTIQFDW